MSTLHAESSGESTSPLILFDGVCKLCASSVRFVVARDRAQKFRFAFLQSPVAERLLDSTNRPADRLQSMVLVVDGRTYYRSTAALQVARRLDGLWPILATLLIIPRPIRDWVYDWIGRHRYEWFGRTDECLLPDPSLERRFIEN